MKITNKILFLCAIILSVSILWANMAAPPTPETAKSVGELFIKENVAIQQEDLVIDLKNRDVAQVSATYFINNQKKIEDLELVFVAEGLLENNFEVMLNNQKVSTKLEEITQMPTSWLAPDSVLVSSNRYIPYYHAGYQPSDTLSQRYRKSQATNKKPQNIFFKLTLLEGKNEIKVKYKAKTNRFFDKNNITFLSEFVYILSPAKNWQSFSRLNVKILLPVGYNATNNLGLKYSDNEKNPTLNPIIEKSFDSIPADYLSVVLSYDASKHLWKFQLSYFGLYFALFAICGGVLWLVGKNILTKSIKIILSIVIAVALFLGLFFVMTQKVDLMNWALEGNLSQLAKYSENGYGMAVFMILGAPIGIAIFSILNYQIINKINKTKQV